MNTLFSNYPPNSKVWVFQADRFLSEDDFARISALCQTFVSQWKAHDIPVIADYKGLYQTFLVFSVSNHGEQTSGCSIDTLLHLIKRLETQFQVSFTNRFVVAYRKTEEAPLELYKHTELVDKLTKGVAPLGFIYNNSLSVLKDLQNNWLIPVEKSWLSTFLPAKQAY